MASEQSALLSTLIPQPHNFDAPIRVDRLHADVCGMIERADARDDVVRKITGLELSVLPAIAASNAVALTAQAALQASVDDGGVELNVVPPNGGRFLRLPPDALFNAGPVSDPFAGREGEVYPWDLADTAWRTGIFGRNDGGVSLGGLRQLALQVFVSRQHERVALSAAEGLLTATSNRDRRSGEADSDDEVDKTIRRLVAERGGRLPVNQGAQLVIALHPTRRRDEVRERIKAVTKPLRPGPVGPRNCAAKKT